MRIVHVIMRRAKREFEPYPSCSWPSISPPAPNAVRIQLEAAGSGARSVYICMHVSPAAGGQSSMAMHMCMRMRTPIYIDEGCQPICFMIRENTEYLPVLRADPRPSADQLQAGPGAQLGRRSCQGAVHVAEAGTAAAVVASQPLQLRTNEWTK